MENMKRKLFLTGLMLIAASAMFAQTRVCDENADFNCFSIVAGKNATADGSVLFGHNEDDGPEYLVTMNVSEKGVWAEMPGMSVSDGYMNRYGVCIASDGCGSREDRDDYNEGGIVYELRLNVFLEAKTAKDALRIIARDMERYGYRASGRTYVVTDPNEGWLVNVVKGHHWVAQRVPDDMVASVPNYYTIGRIDLSDTANFAGSPDIVEYAVKRGWYDPKKDGEFNFRKAYANPNTLVSDHNVPRHKMVMEYLGTAYDIDNVPFAIKADRKIDVRTMRKLLSLHRPERADGSHPSGVCAFDTNVSTIFQLRSFMPLGIGCVAWTCQGKVCAEVHVPWYLGMTRSPEGYQRFGNVNDAIKKHFSDGTQKIDGKGIRERYPDEKYWIYTDRWQNLLTDYSNLIVKRQAVINPIQEKIFNNQEKFEKKLLKMSPEKASEAMNKYTAKLVSEVE